MYSAVWMMADLLINWLQSFVSGSKNLCKSSDMLSWSNDDRPKGEMEKIKKTCIQQFYFCVGSVAECLIVISLCLLQSLNWTGMMPTIPSAHLFDRPVCLFVREQNHEGIKRVLGIWSFTWWPHTYPGPSSHSSWHDQAATWADQTRSNSSLPGSWCAYTHFP